MILPEIVGFDVTHETINFCQPPRGDGCRQCHLLYWVQLCIPVSRTIHRIRKQGCSGQHGHLRLPFIFAESPAAAMA